MEPGFLASCSGCTYHKGSETPVPLNVVEVEATYTTQMASLISDKPRKLKVVLLCVLGVGGLFGISSHIHVHAYQDPE